MRLALCMIVRNEERCLGRCLESVQGLVDHMVVLDTGSTDRTIQIARDFGAEVVEAEWPGAFDEARNQALAHVDADWVLWLDADEWLSTESHEPIRALLNREDAFGFHLQRRNFTADGSYSSMPLLRLWRHHPDLRFVGVVHEHLDPEGVAAAFPQHGVFYTDLHFWHDGYLHEDALAQARRYLPAIRRELEIRPGQLYYEVHLAKALETLQDPSADTVFEAIEARLLADDTAEPDPYAENAIVPLLKRAAGGKIPPNRADRLLRYARGWFSDRPLVLWAVSELEVRRGNLSGAFYVLRDLEALSEESQSHLTTLPGQREALWLNLALIAHQLGRKDVARRNYLRVLETHPDHPTARENLRKL